MSFFLCFISFSNELVDDQLYAFLLLGVLAQIERTMGHKFSQAAHDLKELLFVLLCGLRSTPEGSVGFHIGLHIILGGEVDADHRLCGVRVALFVLAGLWGTLTPFGSSAASFERPVALRPRLTTGLPLSWTGIPYQKARAQARPTSPLGGSRLHHWLPLPQVPIYGAKF